MKDTDAVLAANLEFYRAFADRDFDAMEALWAQRAPVACTHPGWPVLAERAAIMESWDGIMSNPEAPRVTCLEERVYLYGELALVLCEEELEGGTLAASNFFVREDGVWKVAHHHAGQIVARRGEGREARRRDRPPPGRLN